MEDRIKLIIQKYNGNHTTEEHDRMWYELMGIGISGISLNHDARGCPDGSIKISGPLQDMDGNDTEFDLVFFYRDCGDYNEYMHFCLRNK